MIVLFVIIILYRLLWFIQDVEERVVSGLLGMIAHYFKQVYITCVLLSRTIIKSVFNLKNKNTYYLSKKFRKQLNFKLAINFQISHYWPQFIAFVHEGDVFVFLYLVDILYVRQQLYNQFIFNLFFFSPH